MKDTAINLRPGQGFLLDGKLLVVTKHEINQPGKGAAVVQMEARDARTGIKTTLRFRTQEMVERADLYDHDYQYLFGDGDTFTFMDQETFEQLEVHGDVIGDQKVYLQEGMKVSLKTYDGQALAAELPKNVTLQIVEADPVVKGQTASSSYKPAILENGVRILVPPHIEAGTRVVVATADSSYVERAKD